MHTSLYLSLVLLILLAACGEGSHRRTYIISDSTEQEAATKQ